MAESETKRSTFLTITITLGILLLDVVFIAGIVYVITETAPLFGKIMQNIASEQAVAAEIQALGWQAYLVVIALHIMRVFTLFIPAMPIQILSGICFGPTVGSLVSVVGAVVSSLIAIEFTQRLLKRFPGLVKAVSNKMNRSKTLRKINMIDKIHNASPKHRQRLAFGFNLFPVIPNGALQFMFGSVNVNRARYALVVALAFIPSSVISSIMGATLLSGDWLVSVLLLVFYFLIFSALKRLQRKFLK